MERDFRQTKVKDIKGYLRGLRAIFDRGQVLSVVLTPTSVGQKLILIVDDERKIAEMLAKLLADTSYRSVITDSGHQALVLLAKQSVELILSDTGLLRKLQTTYPKLAERLIFVTGDILSSPASTKLSGRIPVVEKPFEPSAVKQAVAERPAWLSSRC